MKSRRVLLGTLSQLDGARERVRAPHDRYAVWVLKGGKAAIDVFAELPEATEDALLAEGIFEELARFVRERGDQLTELLGPKPRAAFHFDAPVDAVHRAFEDAGYEVLPLGDVIASPRAALPAERSAVRVKAPPVERRRSFYVYETPLEGGLAGFVFVDPAAWRTFLVDLYGLPAELVQPADLEALAEVLAEPARDRLWVVTEGVVRESVPLDRLVEVEVDGARHTPEGVCERLLGAKRAIWTVNVAAVPLPALVGRKLTKRDGAVPFAWGVRHDSRIEERALGLGPFGDAGT